MKILLTGGSGQIGREVFDSAEALGWTVVAPGRRALDVRHAEDVSRVLQAHADADFVVNAAAFTAVDAAEDDAAAAYSVNRDAPGLLGAACARLDLPLLHLSTDYVFDGRRSDGYTEDDATGPLSVYGASKLAGEEAVRERLPRHLIVRSSWVFGKYGKNFVKTMLQLGHERPSLAVVADQRGCPTGAADVATAITHMVGSALRPGFADWGTYHYCGSPPATWFEFAQSIFEEARGRESLAVREIEPISSEEFGSRARRPPSSILDCARIRATFGIEQPAWRARLRAVLDVLCGPGR